MKDKRHLPLQSDGIDTAAIATFLIEALDLMRRRNDLADICALLASRVAELLPVETAGVVLADDVLGLHLAGASRHSASARHLIESQFTNGPVTECLVSRHPVSYPDVQSSGSWAEFASICAAEGIHSAYCLPVNSRETVFGILTLLGRAPLSDVDLAVAEILTDVAAVAFLQCDPRYVPATARIRSTDLLQSLDTIEQAKGMLSQRYGTSIDVAYDGMWRIGFERDIGLARLAELVVNRTLDDDTATALSLQFNRPGSAPAE
jgi:transcriptional regulator with GAF, ATPase, and Fis domain